MIIDPERTCELCEGALLVGNVTGVCRSNRVCMQENDSRIRANNPKCRVCDGPLHARNKIGVCRDTPACKKEAKRIHDRQYHQAKTGIKPPKAPRETESGLLPEDGIIDDIAVWIAATGMRKGTGLPAVNLTHIERLEVIKLMLRVGAGVRDMCDNLHVHPSVVRSLLDELGYECVRNEHIAGSKIMIILPKSRTRKES